jgi:hypothetical protein
MNKYNRVLISAIQGTKPGEPLPQIPITTLSEYEKIAKKMNKNCGGICEIVGLDEYQVKPYFDIDDKEGVLEDTFIIEKIIEDIKSIYNNTIYRAYREPRIEDGKMKYSLRCYIPARITAKNIPTVFKDVFEKYNELYGKGFIDTSVYNTNKRLLTPLSNKKRNDIVPELKVIDCSWFDCCATYIKEEYEDLDIKFKDIIDKKNTEPTISYKKIIDDDNENDDNILTDKDKYNYDFILDIINNLNVEKRCVNYDNWINVCFAIIGASKRCGLGKKSCSDLIHHFSKKDKSYDENKVEEWMDINYKRQMEAKKTYGFRQLIHCYLKEDNPEYYEIKFNKDYDTIKSKFEEKIIKILDDIFYIELNHNRDIHKPECYYIKKPNQLVHSYEDDGRFNYMHYCKDGKGNTISMLRNIVDIKSKWWKDDSKRKVDRLIFQPFKLNTTFEKRYFNMFQGFRIQHKDVYKNYDDIELILNHIKNVICNRDQYSYDWFLKYLSRVLKGGRTNVMIMIKGQEGCGKNIILDMIAYGLIGDEYAIATSSPEKQLFNNFNSLLQNRVFTIINEGTSGLRNCMDVIKDIITADKVNIEKKGIDVSTLTNYNNFIGDTNNFNILNITSTDRRFVFFNCNNEYVGNEEYFTSLCNDLKDDCILSSFYHYLIEEINCPGDYDFQLTRPKTSIYKKLQQINLPNPITYLMSIKDDKEILNYRKYKGEIYTTIKCADLYVLYKEWATRFKYEPFTYQNFECKIIEDNKYGITKCIDRQNFKVFKINKVEFEHNIAKYDKLEDLDIIDDDGEFIDEE